jgi:hypothetical protein
MSMRLHIWNKKKVNHAADDGKLSMTSSQLNCATTKKSCNEVPAMVA